jgi:tetratricopeptide (TPR) repeat protein
MSNCTTIEELVVDYLDGELAEPALHAFEAHVATCATCAAMLESYREIRSAYAGLDELDVSPEIAGRVLAAARRTRRHRGLWALAMAAAILVMFGLFRPVGWLASPSLSPAEHFANARAAAHEELQAGNETHAIAHLEDALEADATNPAASDVLIELAGLYFEADQAERALAAVETLEAQFPEAARAPDALRLAGRVQEHLGHYEEALVLYETLEAEDPTSTEATRLRSAIPSPEAFDALGAMGYTGD